MFTAEVSKRISCKLLNTSAAYAAKLSHKRANSQVCEAGNVKIIHKKRPNKRHAAR